MPKDPQANPSASLAEKQARELNLLERAELQALRRTRAQHTGGGRGGERPSKGKGQGKQHPTGGCDAASLLGCADLPGTEVDVPVTAAAKLQQQSKAQALWRELLELQHQGVVDIPTSDAVVFPTLPAAESDLPWEGRLQRTRDFHNRAWGKLKSAMQKETEAAKNLAELSKALQEAREAKGVG